MAKFSAIAAGVLLVVSTSLAAQSSYGVAADLDGDSNTGCTVSSVAGTVAGIEVQFAAQVGSNGRISSVRRSNCQGSDFASAAEHLINYPVGLDLGTDGADVVEFDTEAAGLAGNALRFYFMAQNASAADLTVPAAAVGIGLPGVPLMVPAMGGLALLALSLALLWRVRRHPAFGSTAAFLVLCTTASLVWAANFSSDGRVLDWNGVAPLTTDIVGDSGGATSIDIVASFAAVENGRLFIRLDIADIAVNDNGTPASEARVLILSREGEIASLDVASPWTIKANADLGETINSVHCRAGICVVVHPAPVNAMSVVNAQTLALVRRIDLGKDSDPRDAVFVDDRTVVISFYERDYLEQLDLQGDTTRAIDLSQFADKDGLPEAMMLGACNREIYVQLQRVDHEFGVPSALPPLLAVIDTANNDVAHTIELRDSPALDMIVDCAKRQVIVTEPKAIVQGGGSVEQIDLDTGVASDFLAADEFANGGVQPISQGVYWTNQHTDTGPGPSSHLSLHGAGDGNTYNVFANELVDNMAYDVITRQLFYPNPCATIQADCDNGLHVFDAHTGASLGDSIDPGFSPIEVVLSR